MKYYIFGVRVFGLEVAEQRLNSDHQDITAL